MSTRLKSISKTGGETDGDTARPPGAQLSPEIFRQLYVSLDIRSEDQPVIGVTSAIAGEGRTTVALGLARTLAQDLDSPVSLVEVDLEQSSLSKTFDIPPAPGLSDVLRGTARLSDVRCVVAPNLCLVPAGTVRADTGSLLHQLPLDDPFHGPHSLGGIVILDLPPILAHGYSAHTTSVADSLLLVVRAGVTPAELVREAIARLQDRPPSGVVFNGPRTSLPSWWPGLAK